MNIGKHKGRTVCIDGSEYINFSTTAYLHLAHDFTFQRFLIEGIKQYGHSYGSSPLTQPPLAIYEELEAKLAAYYGAESALLFSTGFAASQAVMNYFVAEGFGIDYGKINHPALHVSFQPSRKNVFATDLADPINCEIFNLNGLPNNQPAVIDASHGFGILDDLVKEAVLRGAVVCGSLNKGLATPAGLLLCSKELKQALQKQANYATSSVPSPAACYALLKAIETSLILQQQEKLRQLLLLVSASDQYVFAPPLPILQLIDSSISIYSKLLEEKMLIWHNEYPKRTGKTVNRVVIHAGLEAQDVRKLLNLI